MNPPIRKLKRLGKVWGVVEGRLVVEGETLPRLGETVYDSRMREVGVVLNVFGPINKFFIEIDPRDKPSYKEGTPLYILQEERASRHTRRS
ncbi:MAG: hypothetical protein J7K78_01625 [Thaumarchaeota archaeon]|nr:hypothetical protein [Nitrososphaerota archaeon]